MQLLSTLIPNLVTIWSKCNVPEAMELRLFFICTCMWFDKVRKATARKVVHSMVVPLAQYRGPKNERSTRAAPRDGGMVTPLFGNDSEFWR